MQCGCQHRSSRRLSRGNEVVGGKESQEGNVEAESTELSVGTQVTVGVYPQMG